MVKAIHKFLLVWSQTVGVSALDRKLLRDLWRLRGQVIAIAAVVGSGVGLLVGVYGVLSSLQLSKDAFYERYRFADVWISAKRAPDSLHDKIAAIPGVQFSETRIVADVTLDMPEMSEPVRGRMISTPEGRRPLLNNFDLRTGSVPTYGRPDDVIVSEAFAKSHNLGIGSGITAVINGKKRKLTIVGIALTPEYIYALAPGQIMPDDKRFGIIWMGRKALAAAFDLDESFNNVSIKLTRGAIEADVIDALDHLLEPYGGIGAYGRKHQISDFFLSNELEQLKSSGAIAPTIFLGVAAFLLNIVLTRLVATEREQIGLLKAFGYSDWDVGMQYMKLVGVITVLGLLIGIGMGLWFGDGMIGMYTEYFKFPLLAYRVDPSVFSSAAAVAVAAAVIGGMSAVRQAIHLSPAVAMAPPVPTSYRRGALGRLLSNFRFSQPTRMIFRHVTRYPRRTGLTVLGISFSVALLVASFFFLDSVQQVINVYFYQSERQTLTVNFVEPRPATVEEEIQHLPGVLATQPVRIASVRLRNGPREERTSLIGLIPNADLNRVLDTDSKPIDPPEGGVALSRHYAEKLGLHIGDMVTVEVMQERRPIRDVPVTQIVDQYLGFAAFMSLEGVNRLMREGPTVTGIHVLTDNANADQLYNRLKNTPAVAAVNQTSAALDNFRNSLDETMYVMIGFYIGFSSLIAVGVAYNSARIALSERARS
ncbi:MAG: ABC transporter permease, partial [Rhodobacteraceae bacterium]|nr:ABC transporter permease [Paracoccaceae bacterium]